MTIQGLINKIFRANQTQNNTVSWSGVNGLKSIQEDIVDTIRQRTFFTVPTTADLVNQGFNNAVLCYVQDHAFFRWEANGVPNGTTIFPANDGGVWVQETLGDTDGTVTSIGVSMPSAFTVSNSPVTTSGVIGITGSGTTSQYIDGTGSLQTFPSLPSNLITGTGTTNYVPKFTSSTNIGNSLAYDNGSTLLIGTTTASTDYSSALLALSKSNNYTYQEIRGSSQATLVLTQGVTANSTTPAVEIFNGYNFGIKYIGGAGGAFSNYPFYYYAGNAAGSGDYIMMQTAGLERLRIVNNGNVLIGTTTDAGYKLNVNGTQLIQFGSTEVGLQMTHSNGNTASIVIGNGSAAGTGNVEFFRNGEYVVQYTGSYVAFRYANLRARNNTTLTLTGGIGYGTVLGTSIKLAPNTSDGGGYTATSGTQSTVVMGNSSNEIWQPSSGNATYNLFTNSPVINTSGTYAGIVRGYYYNPTLTSTTGVTHRAIETTTGDVILNSTSGKVGIGTNSPQDKLDVNGSIRFRANTPNFSAVSDNGVLDYVPTSIFATTPQVRLAAVGTGGIAAGIKFIVGLSTTPIDAMYIAGSSNVLIGTTTDAGYKLDVNGTARVTGAITTGITGTAGTLNLNRSSDGANVGFVRAESSGAGIQIGAGVNMFFSNNGRIVVNSTTTDASAIFKIDSSTQGFLLPRMTDTQILAIASPATGLMVYSTTQNVIAFYDGTGWHKVTHTNL